MPKFPDNLQGRLVVLVAVFTRKVIPGLIAGNPAVKVLDALKILQVVKLTLDPEFRKCSHRIRANKQALAADFSLAKARGISPLLTSLAMPKRRRIFLDFGVSCAVSFSLLME